MKKLYSTVFVVALTGLVAGCQMDSLGDMSWPGAHSSASVNEMVSQALMSNAQLAGLSIRVESDQGNVRLSGYVKTIRQSDVAADVAGKVRGVKMVQNDLIVRK